MQPQWIALDGTVNTRDVGGLPLVDGGVTRSGVLIRSDNLQDLTAADIALLVDELGVRTVSDLRTEVEIASEGPGPLTREPRVEVIHRSLYASAGYNTDVLVGLTPVAETPPAADHRSPEERRDAVEARAAHTYLRYLRDRPDSIVAALRSIAHDDGATIVHCAAGKDRTGVIVAVALAAVGVTREAIVADYAATAERIDAIMDRLRSSETYAADLIKSDARWPVDFDRHTPRAQTMELFLDGLDEQGGAPGWLKSHGWTDDDDNALRARLVA